MTVPRTSHGNLTADPWSDLLTSGFAEWSKLLGTSRDAAAPPDGDPLYRWLNEMWKANPLSALLPLEPGEMAQALQQLWAGWLRDPQRAMATYTELTSRSLEVVANAWLQLIGQPPAAPAVEPEKGDRRFADRAWESNAIFAMLKQTYLLTSATLLKSAAEVQGLDRRQQRRLAFYVRQFADTLSPANFPLTNPAVLREALDTGGQSLLRGLRHLADDLRQGRVSMTDMAAFRPGRNLATTPGQVVARNELVELIQYEPATERTQAVPLLFIPPWINKYYILDLQPQNSLIKYLVEQGFTVFVISWKNPDAALEETTFDDYLDLGPLAAMTAIKAITGSPKVLPIGYCIGGTLLSMALPYLDAVGDDTVDAAAFLVSLQDFAEVGDTAVFIDEPRMAYIEGQMMERGYLPSSEMSTMFNLLRANDLIWNYVVNNYLLGKQPPAFDLLYWNADSTRMARAAHSFYLRNTYIENNLVKPNAVRLKGQPIDLGRITQDLYAVGTREDHIVPWGAALQLRRLVSGDVRFVLGNSGHIAGIINPPSKGKGSYWTDGEGHVPATWLATATQHEGSWWADWVAWLRRHTGKEVAPPPLGNADYPPLAPAPGAYVLEK
jgi:polyhydroxyalkanoate synthase